MSNLQRMKNKLEAFERLEKLAEDAGVLVEMGEESGDDAEVEAELSQTLSTLEADLSRMEIQTMLSGKYDSGDCILTINAGAGGTDAQDWAQILLRMYSRWMERHGYVTEVADQTYGDEAGIKSVTVIVKGPYAYGHLRQEAGVHRLVRISPFNANGKRQTSFASVEVMPKVDHNIGNLEIDPKDLRVDTFRASGAGGQHINKTDSAVRITHIPTGIVAQSQASRSQISNRETALGILKSRLILLMEEQHKQQINELRGDLRSIAWGHQIRSYVFHPYKLVKDLRTNEERTDLNDVLDGDIDGFIQAALRRKMEAAKR